MGVNKIIMEDSLQICKQQLGICLSPCIWIITDKHLHQTCIVTVRHTCAGSRNNFVWWVKWLRLTCTTQLSGTCDEVTTLCWAQSWFLWPGCSLLTAHSMTTVRDISPLQAAAGHRQCCSFCLLAFFARNWQNGSQTWATHLALYFTI